MQHIVNIAFDFDDEKVKTLAETAVEKDIDTIIKTIILDEIAPNKKSSWCGKVEIARDWGKIYKRIDSEIEHVLKEELREEIIEQAADKLVESYKRTKAWKEATKEVLDGK